MQRVGENMNIEEIKFPCLRKYIQKCEDSLLRVGKPKAFIYPESLIEKDVSYKVWKEHVGTIKKLNSDFLSSLKGNANIYAIYIKTKNNEKWKLRYIGQRKAENMSERIAQHLIDTSKNTGSKLEKVRSELSQGSLIGLRFIKVNKDSLRRFVEEEIISRNKSELLWNAYG